MNHAQKIEFKDITPYDFLLIRYNGNLHPVKVVERKPLTIYYKPFKFSGLGYEGDDQHAFYKWEGYRGEPQRLLKKDHKEIYRIRKGENSFPFLQLEHKAYTNQYRFHLDENNFEDEEEPVEEEPVEVAPAPVEVEYVPLQPPNA